MKKWLTKFTPHLIGILILAMTSVIMPIPAPAQAATTVEITVNATPAWVEVSSNATAYNFGVVAASSTTDTPTAYFGIVNTESTVITNHAISTNASAWSSAGVGWTHNDGGTAAANTAALKASKGTGAFDVVVQFVTPDNIATNQPAGASYDAELRLLAPTSFTDKEENTIKVIITATAA